MRAVRITRTGGPEVLAVETVEAPALGPDEVRVAVRAAGVNRADLLQCRGLYPAPPGVVPDIPGLEFAGEVIEVGARVRSHGIGDRVMGLVGGGAYAEQVALHARELLPVPDDMDFVEAAAIPEAFVTAFDALHRQGGLGIGSRVLIHAAGSGVGTAAIQLVAAAGGVAYGTSRTPDKLDRARDLGLAEAIVVKDGRFADAVLALAGEGVDLILDLVGGGYVAEGVRCLRIGGRLVLVGLLAGVRCDLPLAVVLSRRVELRGTVLRSRAIEEKIEVAQAFARQVVPLFARGALRPVVAGVHDMAAAGEAHRRMQADDLFGKLVLTWGEA
ncbi:MAG: NAD(P)H-quinone oxidoreductase [bacterium]